MGDTIERTVDKLTGTAEASTDLPRDLGNGLVMRLARTADREPYAQMLGWVFGRDHYEEHDAVWGREFIAETHPAGGPSRVTLVEDTRADNKVVSTVCLIPQTWTYAGIPFEVGRPEAVATAPAYRRRGLVRVQFDYWHARSAALGHQLQAITGIPWYYRQFGYEYAIDLGGGHVVPFSSVPALKDGQTEPFRLRPLTAGDLAFVAPLYSQECARSLVACPRPAWLWEHLLSGYSPECRDRRPFRVIEGADGRPVGYVGPTRDLAQQSYVTIELALCANPSWRDVAPPLFRALVVMAKEEATAQGKEVNSLMFELDREHPLLRAVPEMFGTTRRPYAWYVRVADVPGFIRHVAPALEARLASSPMSGYSGELKVSEFRGGFRLAFKDGRLVTCEPWTPVDGEMDVHLPPRVFLQLLFGRKSIAELRDSYADAWAKDEADVLLNALFPKKGSVVIPVG